VLAHLKSKVVSSPPSYIPKEIRLSSTYALPAVLLLFTLLAPSAARTAPVTVLASEVGAKLDSNLMKGGGTDDTTILQRILDRAGEENPVTLIIDGPALVSGLVVGSNTALECTNNAGLYLKAHSIRPLIQNRNRSKTEMLDMNVAIRGCFLNGNRDEQLNTAIPNDPKTIDNEQNKDAGGEWISGIRLFGVSKLSITNTSVYNFRSFAVHIRNSNQIEVRNVNVDNGWRPEVAAKGEYINTDGINLRGPINNALIENVTLRTGDDSIALHTGDDLPGGSVIGRGMSAKFYSIRDVIIKSVILRDARGFRFLSYGGNEIDRVTIENVTGSITSGWLILFGQDYTRVNNEGRIGSIFVNNLSVNRARDPLAGTARNLDKTEAARRVEWFGVAYAGDGNFGDVPLINVNTPAERIVLRNLSTTAYDSRPIVRLGPSAVVGHLKIEAQITDACACAKPYDVDGAARIRSLEAKLVSRVSDESDQKVPPRPEGGQVGGMQHEH
jgi:hypothetical protein